MKSTFFAAAAALLVAAPAAAETVDGVLDASYGTAKSVVTYAPGAPTSNFATPTPFTDQIGYSIYLTTDANNVYGFLQADATTLGGSFSFTGANLYFDIDPDRTVPNGSDLGFEITNGRAFVPGMPGYSAGTATSPLAGLTYAVSADGLGVEFSIANSLFMSQIAGLTYYGDEEFPMLGDDVVLRLSQSFGYSVAGGATYGNDRLGRVTLGASATPAVPEPATWAMMIMGFGLVGGAMRRRATKVAFA